MIFGKLFKNEAEKMVAQLRPRVAQIGALEEELQTLTDEELRAKTDAFRARLQDGATLDDILVEAFAVVREAGRRTLNQRHYDVQLIGGMILHNRGIAEMRTGEGKTLVATLPVYLNALAGKGVHVVTVNDYLSRRDTVWMGQIYAFLGLTIGVINGANTSYLYDKDHTEEQDEHRDEVGSFKVVYDYLRPCTRKEAYEADITYGTNNEFAFDYLRDNLAYTKEELVQRGFNYAIVDEIDSILIDESRTPLIISAQSQDAEDLYGTFAKVATKLSKETDFTIDEKLKAATLTDDGIARVEKILGIDNIYTDKGIKYVHHLENAVRAKALFTKDKEYVIRDGEIVIVDEFTGRLQPGRRWSEGLHQAIEAKEGLKVHRESRTVASITFQNYFRLYENLAGMTGTALTSQEEFMTVYKLAVVPVPTNKEIKRVDNNDLIFQTEQGKFQALAAKIKELNTKGQPVLVGTASIDKNELLSEYLNKEGIKHEVLNAKNHEREGEIIAQAGRKGGVTIATNMAGRGVDIILGGSPLVKAQQEEVLSMGGLAVLGTERHEARRIDNQLRGRAGRQGDDGFTQFFVSLEDSLMRVFASDAIKKMMGRFGIPEDQPIENRLITRALESAQTKIEGFYFDSRKQVLEYDNVLNQQRQTVYTLRRGILEGDAEKIRGFLDDLSSAIAEAGDIIERKEQMIGEEQFLSVIGQIILRAVDMHWMEHLDTMDYLRSSVNLRAYGQRDPLIEYKKEGLRLFKEMEHSLNDHVMTMISRLGENTIVPQQPSATPVGNLTVTSGGGDSAQQPSRPVQNTNKVGRNDPCPCGKTKPDGTPIKHKNCCGKN